MLTTRNYVRTITVARVEWLVELAPHCKQNSLIRLFFKEKIRPSTYIHTYILYIHTYILSHIQHTVHSKIHTYIYITICCKYMYVLYICMYLYISISIEVIF